MREKKRLIRLLLFPVPNFMGETKTETSSKPAIKLFSNRNCIILKPRLVNAGKHNVL